MSSNGTKIAAPVRVGKARSRRSGVKRENIWRKWKKRGKREGGGFVVVRKEFDVSRRRGILRAKVHSEAWSKLLGCFGSAIATPRVLVEA